MLLSIHAHRENDPVGIFVRLVDFSDNQWSVLDEECIWSGAPAMRVSCYDDMGENLKFGQPAIMQLNDNEFLAYQWAIQNGQGRILAHSLKIKA